MGHAAAHWGAHIRQFRHLHTLKQSALADMVGVDQATISRWEKNDSVPNLGLQRRLRDMMRSTAIRDSAISHAVAASPHDVVLSDSDRVFLAASASFAELHGVPADEIIGMTNHRIMDEQGEQLWQAASRAGFFRGKG